MTDWDTLPELLSYADAAKVIDPSGKVLSARSIRSVVNKGELRRKMVANRAFVYRDDVRRYVQCPDPIDEAPRPPEVPVSRPIRQRSGKELSAHGKAALEAANRLVAMGRKKKQKAPR